jgi:hypothetical protein
MVVMILRRSRLWVLMDEFIWVLFECLLTGLRAEVVRLAVVRRRWLAIVSPHPTDGVAVLAGRTETATINIQQEPGERERDEVEIERVVEFEVRLLGRRLAARQIRNDSQRVEQQKPVNAIVTKKTPRMYSMIFQP